MSTLTVGDGSGFLPGDRIKLGGDATVYVVLATSDSQVLHIGPVWWWAALEAVLTMLD